MTMVYLFDVDGTLTLPRSYMNEEFAEFFYGFCAANLVYLVSGSDHEKIREQVPHHVLMRCRGVFTCSGAEYFEKGEKVYAKRHDFDEPLIARCKQYVENSPYISRTGNHLEFRTGMLNVSTIGRNATDHDRKVYFQWDAGAGERERMVAEINAEFPGYEASSGGEISIDIVPKGWNKSVVKKRVLEEHPAARLSFFGDRIVEGGNDMPLAQALEDGTGLHMAHSVDHYRETWRMLEQGSQLRLAA